MDLNPDLRSESDGDDGDGYVEVEASETDTFESLGVCTSLINACALMGIRKPTEIQVSILVTESTDRA